MEFMDRRKTKRNQYMTVALCTMAASCVMAFAACAGVEPSGAAVVEYRNLSQLVQDGNLSLRQVIDNYEGNKQNYQDLLDTLREEQATDEISGRTV